MRVSQVTVTGVAASAWLPVDQYSSGTNDGIFFKVGAGATVTLQVTADDVFDPAVTPIAFDLAAPFAAMVANVAGALPFIVKAIRMNQTAGATTSTLQFVDRGII